MHQLEDKEEERAAAVSCQTIRIVRSLKPQSDKGWMIILILYKKNTRIVNRCRRN